MSTPQRRVYSFLVHGFRAHDGAREDIRQASVVAFDADEAIATAQRLVAPRDDHHIDNWVVVSVQEINPKEAREWIAWHAVTRDAVEA